jgi:hypothetical protein
MPPLVDQHEAKDPSPLVTDKTRVGRGTRWRLVRRAAIVPLLMLLAIPCAPFLAIPIDVYRSHRQRQRLLHETDHHALLAASRELMGKHAGQDIAQPDQDPRVPRIIRELEPSYMGISSEQLRVELHGGFDHYGFVAFAKGANAGDRWTKLVDGLYYYTE